MHRYYVPSRFCAEVADGTVCLQAAHDCYFQPTVSQWAHLEFEYQQTVHVPSGHSNRSSPSLSAWNVNSRDLVLLKRFFLAGLSGGCACRRGCWRRLVVLYAGGTSTLASLPLGDGRGDL
jgi:hypothetical protein